MATRKKRFREQVRNTILARPGLLSLTGAVSLLALAVALAGCGGGSGSSGGSDGTAGADFFAAGVSDDYSTREVTVEASVLLGAESSGEVAPAGAGGIHRRMRHGIPGVVTELNPGVSFRLTHLPPPTSGPVPADARPPLTVTLSAETAILEPDDAAATLASGAAVLVQGRLDRQNRTIAAARVTVIPVVGKVAELQADALTFDLRARLLHPTMPHPGTVRPGDRWRDGDSSPEPVREPVGGTGERGNRPADVTISRPQGQRVHVVTTGATVYQNRDPGTGAAAPAAFTDVKEGHPVALFGTMDPNTRTLTAARVDILPVPVPRPQP